MNFQKDGTAGMKEKEHIAYHEHASNWSKGKSAATGRTLISNVIDEAASSCVPNVSLTVSRSVD